MSIKYSNNISKDALVELIKEAFLEVKAEKEFKSDEISNDEVRMGIEDEMEHTNDPVEAEKIALDHLRKNPTYYSQMKVDGLDEEKMSSKDKAAQERIVKTLKSKYPEFKQKYGTRAKQVMYAVATKLAQKEN